MYTDIGTAPNADAHNHVHEIVSRKERQESVLPGNQGGERGTEVGELGADSPQNPQQFRAAASQEGGDNLGHGIDERVEV